MLRIKKVKKGDAILAEHFNLLVDAILERTPLSFVNGFLTRTPHGFHVRGNRGGSGGGAAVDLLPWDIAIVASESGVKARFAVPGSINGFVPSNIFADFTIAAGGVYYVKCNCSTDGKVITAISVAIDSSPPTAQTPTMSILPSSFQHVVGMIKDGTPFNIARKALAATSSMRFRTDKSPPADPGEMAYAEWYVWNVT